MYRKTVSVTQTGIPRERDEDARMADQPHHPDTGGIRTTGAEPGPARAHWKVALLIAVTVAVLVLIIGTASCFAAYFAFQAFLPAGDAMRTSLSDPGVLRAVAGFGVFCLYAAAALTAGIVLISRRDA
jgi:ABC-2 type transport system permease protein